MQEQVTQKTMALSIKTAKISVKALQAAIRQFLKMYRKQRDTPRYGKQTLKQLMRHSTGVSNIEITDANIKVFFPAFFYAHKQQKKEHIITGAHRVRT